jgi:hypothetical protein
VLYAVLGNDSLRHGEWQSRSSEAGVPATVFDRHRKPLIDTGLVIKDGSKYKRAMPPNTSSTTTGPMPAVGASDYEAAEYFASLSPEELAAMGVQIGD